MAYEWQREKDAPQSVAAVEPQRPQPAPAPVEEKPVEKPVAQPVEKSDPKPEPAAAEPAPPPDTHRLVLRMAEESWLEVRDGAGRDLVSSLNPAGSERVVRGQPPFQLVIGNAAHVEITYDGKRVDLAPHMRGEVARFTLK
jgi:cytoskeleton protein RodZ